MKKLFLLSFLAVSFLSISTNSFAKDFENTVKIENASYACRFSQCQAIAKSTGKQCKHCVSKKGDFYCWQHSE